MKSGVTTTVDHAAKIISGIADLVGTRVMVGVPADKTDRRDDGAPINNAALAYIHENGAPEVSIPARPFIQPGLDEKKDAIVSGLRKVGEAALDGRPEAMDRGFHAVGLKAQAAIRAKITTGPFLALKPATLAARRRRGRTGDKPLIDTAQLRNALNYVIRKA